jgi:phospholipase/carboxylesterase
MLSGPTYGPSTGGPPSSLVVLLHGVGADGADLIDLAPFMAAALPETLFVAPDAPYPCDMAPFGRQWFSLQDRRPATLAAAARKAAAGLDHYLDALLQQHRLAPGKLALLGFSQGAMMALHVAFRRSPAIAGVVGWSGALLGAEALSHEIRARPPVLLVHGAVDEVVPFAALAHAAQALEALSVQVRAVSRADLAHAIDEAGIQEAVVFLKRVLTGDPRVLTPEERD